MKHSAIIILICLAYLPVFAQTMPTVSSPEMPAFSSFPKVTQSNTPAANEPAKNTQTADKTGTKSARENESYLTAASLADFTRYFSGNTGESGDIISSLLGKNSSQANNSATTNTLLQQILTQLETMQKEADEKPVFDSIQEKPQTFDEKPKNKAKIIRFTANGYNLLSTCREIFSSGKSTDGSFLITGDRKYLSNNETRSETFYFLFNKSSDKTYDVAVTVLQDSTNIYSFLYQLEGRAPLTATSIGNLVMLTINEPEWKFDLLIDIGDMN